MPANPAFDATQNLRGGMRYKGVPPFPETRAYVKRVLGLYGGARNAFDENLTGASPWLAAGGR